MVGSAGTAVGLDVEPGMIAQAKANAAKAHSRATFGVASITEIPYPDNSFDVVTSSLVYHHLNQAEKVAGLQEVVRVLKPNGRFLIVDLNPTRRGLAVRLPGHSQLAQEDYVSREVVEQLAAAGFANITAGAHPFNQLSYALGVKMLRLIAKLHGIEPEETPDYGLDVPKLAKERPSSAFSPARL
ncbi:MAG: methyltransferase domain-containing protein [Ardenticatenaceae bacterium]|nr:methyltransferase domain-containing protein [Ardenticatenaceae bacterium]